MGKEITQKIQDIAHSHGFTAIFDKAQDNTYIDCTLEKEGISIDIAIPNHQGMFYAYSIESPGLPREIYPDETSNGFSEAQRSAEILQSIDNLMGKSILFHPKPRLFSKERGYVELSIDGKVMPVPQRHNYFGLPVTSTTN